MHSNQVSDLVDFMDLNAQVNVVSSDGVVQLEKDREAARQYFLQHVNPNTVYFADLEEKLEYLFENDFYDRALFEKYSIYFVKELFKRAYAYKHRFASLAGAMKFYAQYAAKTYSGDRYLERYEDRLATTALYLAQGDESLAMRYLDEMITGRFQPATPTFSNAGKAHGGLPVSCYLLDVQDNLESLGRVQNSCMSLSKLGGGVAVNLTNIRATGDPIQRHHNKASGVVPFMKLLEDTFSWIDQLGTRPGAGAVYISIHHPDVLQVLDTRRENADEKIRIKTLSVGLVVTDLLFEAAKKNQDIYQFSPYDVMNVYGKSMSQISITEHYQEMIDNPNIRKTTVSARRLLQEIAAAQFESGYPYLLFEDSANRANNTPNIGRIAMSNLCSEILEPQTPSTFNPDFSYDHVGLDISCNLGSINIARIMENGEHFGDTINTAVRALTSVSEHTHIPSVPSVDRGNHSSHAIGLGAMNLHGFLGAHEIEYGSFEALDFVNLYFSTVLFHAISASCEIAKEKDESFYGFEGSRFDTGEFFEPFLHARFSVEDEDLGGHDLFPKTQKVKDLLYKARLAVPTRDDWENLYANVATYGMYNRNLIAVAPTGSIAMVNGATKSIHPVDQPIYVHKEKLIGRVYWPSAEMTAENAKYFQSAFNLGFDKVIETYNTAAPYVDQGLSLTLFAKKRVDGEGNQSSEVTTRDVNRAQILAWNGSDTFHGKDTPDAESGWDAKRRKRLGAVSKTMYYIRFQQEAIDGTAIENANDAICESCVI